MPTSLCTEETHTLNTAVRTTRRKQKEAESGCIVRGSKGRCSSSDKGKASYLGPEFHSGPSDSLELVNHQEHVM